MEDTFRRFYERLLSMAREGFPAEIIAEKIRQAIPDSEKRKPLIGHLRDSQNAFEAEGNDEAAATLERVIEALEDRECT